MRHGTKRSVPEAYQGCDGGVNEGRARSLTGEPMAGALGLASVTLVGGPLKAWSNRFRAKRELERAEVRHKKSYRQMVSN